jgi:hypothetical protein
VNSTFEWKANAYLFKFEVNKFEDIRIKNSTFISSNDQSQAFTLQGPYVFVVGILNQKIL